jgi:hypothetical protein
MRRHLESVSQLMMARRLKVAEIAQQSKAGKSKTKQRTRARR